MLVVTTHNGWCLQESPGPFLSTDLGGAGLLFPMFLTGEVPKSIIFCFSIGGRLMVKGWNWEIRLLCYDLKDVDTYAGHPTVSKGKTY